MKKLLAVMSASVLAAGMCAGFVACGNGDGDLGIDENTQFSEIVSDKVTEKQWNDAFKLDENNVPVNAKNYKYVFTEIYEGGETFKFEASVDGNKIYYKSTGEYNLEEYGKETVECYAELIGTDYQEYYFYELIDGVWEREKEYAGETLKYGYAFGMIDLYDWDEEKEEVIIISKPDYSDEKKGYVFSDNQGDSEVSCVVKFKNGKYCGYECYRDGVLTGSLIIYSYGNEKVTLPTVTE